MDFNIMYIEFQQVGTSIFSAVPFLSSISLKKVKKRLKIIMRKMYFSWEYYKLQKNYLTSFDQYLFWSIQLMTDSFWLILEQAEQVGCLEEFHLCL